MKNCKIFSVCGFQLALIIIVFHLKTSDLPRRNQTDIAIFVFHLNKAVYQWNNILQGNVPSLKLCQSNFP
jgi:hypothetical protein